MIMTTETFSLHIALAINGIFTGLGVELRTYIANQHIVDGTKK